MRGYPPLAPLDLEEIHSGLAPLWPELAQGRLLLTGCTGFFGPWLLEPLLQAEDRLGLGLKVWVLTRDAGAFRRRLPHLAAHPALACLEGDVRAFENPGHAFTHLIHGANASTSLRETLSPEGMEATIVEGTRRVLAGTAGVRKALFLSSGAVYGPQPPGVAALSEEVPVGVMAPGYAEGKRQAEALCAEAAYPVAIARCFAFLAPHLPLEAHFAAGNFLGAALGGRSPEIRGDGRAIRSYLYGTDLARWLFTILLRGQGGRPYNVGSECSISIHDLAAAVAPGLPVTVAASVSGAQPSRYVPSTVRARAELGLAQTVALPEAIRRTLAWHRQADVLEVP